MQLKRTENYRDLVLLGRETMSVYFEANGIPWNLEERLSIYATVEVYEILDNDLKGYVALREKDDKLFSADIQVLEPFRNLGYGTTALEMVMKLAKARGYTSVFLKVFKTSPALKLYLRNGYSHVAEEKHVYVLQAET